MRRTVVSLVDAASRRWPTSTMMLAGITAPSRRAAPPSGRLILPRPDQYGQRRLRTSPDTAPAVTASAGANTHTRRASAEVYASRPPSDSSRSEKSEPGGHKGALPSGGPGTSRQADQGP